MGDWEYGLMACHGGQCIKTFICTACVISSSLKYYGRPSSCCGVPCLTLTPNNVKDLRSTARTHHKIKSSGHCTECCVAWCFPWCGVLQVARQIEWEKASTQEHPLPDFAPPPVVRMPTNAFCPSCGAGVDRANNRFCTACGGAI